MKRLATLVLVSGLLAGCSIPLMTGGKTPVSTRSNQPVEPLGGVSFKPISAANSRLLNAGGNAGALPLASATAPTTGAMVGGATADAAMSIGKAAPMPAPGGGPAGGGFSGNIWSSYGYGAYFGGYGGGGEEPMALVSVTEAETAGGKGSFQEVVKAVAAPVLKDWAEDGRLVSSSASLASDGAIFEEPGAQAQTKPGFDMYGGGYYGSAPGWRLNYLSPSRREALNFYVTAQKTLIIRMRWAPLSLAPEAVAIDSAVAIKKLIAAIEDKGFRGEEEKSGLDYFMGTAFEQPQMPFGDEQQHKAEVVYNVPPSARWNVSLQSVMGKLVWDLNYYNQQAYPQPMTVGVAVATPAVMTDAVKFSVQQAAAARPAIMPMPMPMPSMTSMPTGEWRESYFENSARGMVDAQTGAVIRFTRPMKHYYRDYSYQQPIKPEFPPDRVPNSSPTPVPTPTPGVSEGSTGSDGQTK